MILIYEDAITRHGMHNLIKEIFYY